MQKCSIDMKIKAYPGSNNFEREDEKVFSRQITWYLFSARDLERRSTL
jgi:hypothetical protein